MAHPARAAQQGHEYEGAVDALHNEAERLRYDLLTADIGMAHSFLNLARYEFETGDPEHGRGLIEKSRTAVRFVQRLMDRLPADRAAEIREKLDELKSALHYTEALHDR